jgi:hypothetical protein
MDLWDEAGRVAKAQTYGELITRAKSIQLQTNTFIEDARNFYEQISTNPNFDTEDRTRFLTFRNAVKAGLQELLDRI